MTPSLGERRRHGSSSRWQRLPDRGSAFGVYGDVLRQWPPVQEQLPPPPPPVQRRRQWQLPPAQQQVPPPTQKRPPFPTQQQPPPPPSVYEQPPPPFPPSVQPVQRRRQRQLPPAQQQPPQWPLELAKDQLKLLKKKSIGKLWYIDKAQGLINPRGEPYKHIFKSVHGYDLLSLPESHRILRTGSDLRDYLDRTHCMLLLHALSKQKVRICLRVRKAIVTKQRDKGDRVDQATVLILSIALRPKTEKTSWLIGELIGLSKPSTLEYLQKYLRPPLVNASIILSLVNATVRQITQPRHANEMKYGSFVPFRLAPPIIARLLMNPKKKATAYFLRNVRVDLIKSHQDEHEELGMKLGLVLAGIEMALHCLVDEGRRARELVELFLDCLFGAVSGVGPFNALPTIHPLVKYIWKVKAEHHEKRIHKFWKAIWENLQSLIDDTLECKDSKRFADFEKREKWMRIVMNYNKGPSF